MASERAKELAAKQKAEAKAAKLAKKNSTNPADWGTWRKLKETYKATAEVDKKLTPLVVGVSVGIVVVSVVIGLLLDALITSVLFGILIAATACTFILTRRAETASYKKYEDQVGGAQVALMMLDNKKWSTEPNIAADRFGTVVHRAFGPNGLILIGEGEPNRVKSLLATEKKRHEAVAYGITVQTVQAGKREGQVRIQDLAKHIKKLPKSLEKPQITDLKQRLKALDATRGRVPIPKGPLPTTRGSRRAMRG